MDYKNYFYNSLLVFLVSFFFGIYVNRFFEYYSSKYDDTNIKIWLSVAQLASIISITYILHEYKIFRLTFETYNPHVLFSSFLFSLQTNMINTFKLYLFP